MVFCPTYAVLLSVHKEGCSFTGTTFFSTENCSAPAVIVLREVGATDQECSQVLSITQVRSPHRRDGHTAHLD